MSQFITWVFTSFAQPKLMMKNGVPYYIHIDDLNTRILYPVLWWFFMFIDQKLLSGNQKNVDFE